MDSGLPEGSEPRPGGGEDAVTTEAESFMDTAPPTTQKTPTAGFDSTHDPPITAAAPPAPDEDDDVVLVEAPPPAPPAGAQASAPSPKQNDCAEKNAVATAAAPTHAAKTPTPSAPAPSPAPTTAAEGQSETIVIDDEEDSFEQKDSSSQAAPVGAAPPTSGSTELSSTEPDSEIKIANVTTLGVAASGSAVATGTETSSSGSKGDMNLMISSVTSLQGVGSGLEQDNSLQIGGTFSLNPEAQTEPSTSRPATFNPGRVGTANEPVQNGEATRHQRSGNGCRHAHTHKQP